MGFAIVDGDTHRAAAVEYGTVTSPAGIAVPVRLKMVYDDVSYIIERFKPDCMAIETLLFNNNAKTAIVVGQARGVLILCAANAGLPIHEYTPLQVKQAVTGYGRADKNQVGMMVQRILGLHEIPRPDDAADAVAVALCRIRTGLAR